MTLNDIANEVDIMPIIAVSFVIMAVALLIGVLGKKASMAVAEVESMDNARLVSRRSAQCPTCPSITITRLIFEDPAGNRVDLQFNEKGNYIPVEGDTGTVFYKNDIFVEFKRN